MSQLDSFRKQCPSNPKTPSICQQQKATWRLGCIWMPNAELEEIDPDVRHVPEVLEVRLEIYRALEKWELMQVVARKLAQYDPTDIQWTVSWAYATRRAECIEAAKAILLEAV